MYVLPYDVVYWSGLAIGIAVGTIRAVLWKFEHNSSAFKRDALALSVLLVSMLAIVPFMPYLFFKNAGAVKVFTNFFVFGICAVLAGYSKNIGLLVFSVGVYLNGLVVIANGFSMPVSTEAAQAVFIHHIPSEIHHIMTETTWFPWLADIIPMSGVPAKELLRKTLSVMSVGDALVSFSYGMIIGSFASSYIPTLILKLIRERR